MKNRIVTGDVWRTAIRRYAIASAIGAVACIIMFRQLYIAPPGQSIPWWLALTTAFAGLLMLGGIFGMALSFFLRLWHKEG